MKILFVCLGNICRSPTAEAVYRSRFSSEGLFLDSAGTGSWHIGKAPDARMLATLASHGIDASDLRARQFGAADFEQFDLIIAMDEQNRRDIEQLRPPGATTPVRCLLEFSGTHRGDVTDPYYEDEKGFELCFNQVVSGCEGLWEQLKR
ncbi:low molecular weight protein-tyrosine-phosphatase [uncultured Umboniibacter sp.]|uniref:low molecular weight protein-tyrosine-phosphatase n=1 Tax=uncultured Umboniibacter sp. TaxID=1798917 RepID=UPI00261C5563|nr:low molecular weight protein-tyrosine-phosphatase [uncultured Umboniibacter sp.]